MAQFSFLRSQRHRQARRNTMIRPIYISCHGRHHSIVPRLLLLVAPMSFKTSRTNVLVLARRAS
eukprot:scaffold359617_cov21-Prasinocladus_malaysianus.AAC.1